MLLLLLLSETGFCWPPSLFACPLGARPPRVAPRMEGEKSALRNLDQKSPPRRRQRKLGEIAPSAPEVKLLARH